MAEPCEISDTAESVECHNTTELKTHDKCGKEKKLGIVATFRQSFRLSKKEKNPLPRDKGNEQVSTSDSPAQSPYLPSKYFFSRINKMVVLQKQCLNDG